MNRLAKFISFCLALLKKIKKFKNDQTKTKQHAVKKYKHFMHPKTTEYTQKIPLKEKDSMQGEKVKAF